MNKTTKARLAPWWVWALIVFGLAVLIMSTLAAVLSGGGGQ